MPLLLLILWVSAGACVEPMKTSIFDMNFILPPMLEMTEVEKDNPKLTGRHSNCKGDGC